MHCMYVCMYVDEDVLDTWFSSGLFPFSIFGWPDTVCLCVCMYVCKRVYKEHTNVPSLNAAYSLDCIPILFVYAVLLDGVHVFYTNYMYILLLLFCIYEN